MQADAARMQRSIHRPVTVAVVFPRLFMRLLSVAASAENETHPDGFFVAPYGRCTQAQVRWFLSGCIRAGCYVALGYAWGPVRRMGRRTSAAQAMANA